MITALAAGLLGPAATAQAEPPGTQKTSVITLIAVEAVGQDRVDQRFFDVTSLHDYGYGDHKIDRIPLLSNGFRSAGAVLRAGPVPFGYDEQTAIAAAEHHVAVTPSKLALRAIASSYTLFLQDKGALPCSCRGPTAVASRGPAT